MLDKSKTYAYDSRKIRNGDHFICLPNGDKYINEALNKGAVDVINLSREEFALQANNYFDYPTEKVTLIGVTGTNGKTSVSYFVSQLLEQFGYNVLVIGTITNELTTPESWDILNQISRHIEFGGTHVVLEVSSHGIDQKRVFGFDFDIKCLTNITQDHLDYHKTFDAYKNTKLTFMEEYPGKSIYVEQLNELDSSLFPQIQGDFHAKNISAAFEICCQIGMPAADLNQFLSKLIPPKGRFEALNIGQPFHVIIDFAHTPEALKIILKNAQKLKSSSRNKCICIFGCGGDRDKSKRPIMGRIANDHCDFTIISSDNSRSESTKKIIQDIQNGMSEESSIVIEDRQDAIRHAIQLAKVGDIIIIAGKGHESRQYENGYSFQFNDHDITLFELLKHRENWKTKWSVDTIEDNPDVIFVNKNNELGLQNQELSLHRVIKVPTNKKIKHYLEKINGKKILVLENENRHSLSTLLSLACYQSSSCEVFKFDKNKPVKDNLLGLTLIEQTNKTIMIQIDPDFADNLSLAIKLIQPEVIIVGDIFDINRIISAECLKNIDKMINETAGSDVLINSMMTDLVDSFKNDGGGSKFQIIESNDWLQYYEKICERIFENELFGDEGAGALIVRVFHASGWSKKVFFNNIKTPLFVLDCDNGALDIRQKIDYFSRNSSQISHYLSADNSFRNERNNIEEISLLHQHKICMIEKDMSETKANILAKNLEQYPNHIHILWKSKNSSIKQLMESIL